MSRPGAVIGVDPGVHGAMCLMTGKTIIEIVDLPAAPVHLASGKARREIDAYALGNIIDVWATEWLIVQCAIERVQAIGGSDGAVGAFAFGECAGTIRGVISSHYIPIDRPTPQQWRRALGIPKAAKGDKSAVITMATEFWPAWVHHWQAKSHADRAEAALIALFAAKRLAADAKA